MNDKLVQTEIFQTQLLSHSNGEMDTLEIGYSPGKLHFDNQKDYDQIFKNSDSDDLFLRFYFDNQSDKLSGKRFVLKLEKTWFKQGYIILRVYDLRYRKIRRKFVYDKFEDHVLEVDLPGHSTRRVRKK